MSKNALTFDIGGTKIYYSVIDESGKIVSEIKKFKTPDNTEDLKKILLGAIREFEDLVDAVGVSTAGAVENENKRVISSTANLPRGYNKIDFQALSKKPVFVENDANAAAWAEHAIGASKDCPTSIILTFGTGVGGGIILNNKLYRGKSGGAGEMHFKIFADKRRKCTCGAWDCYEAYASGTGLKHTAMEMLKLDNISTYDVIEGVKSGDFKMKEVFDSWQEHIIVGLVGLANIFDPDCFVLSGSMGEFTDEKFIEKQVNKEVIASPVRVLKAKAGNFSGMIGAGLLALGK